MIRVEHPAIGSGPRPNFYIVHTAGYSVGFSYQTAIAFNEWAGEGWQVRVNDWGPTTGKHLNWFDDGDKSCRLSGSSFEARLSALESRHHGEGVAS